MSRVYGEPVEVQTREDGRPVRFAWRGRLYTVIAVQEHWMVNRDWWRESRPSPRIPSSSSGGSRRRRARASRRAPTSCAGTSPPAPGRCAGSPTDGGPAEFAHLHVASSFSLRYGTATPAALAARAASLGMSALALTDRDGLYGAFKHVQACADAGIKPLLGADLGLRAAGGTTPRTPRTGSRIVRPASQIRSGG